MTSALAMAVLVSHILAAEPNPAEDAARAAAAAEKAALAAEKAAEAAQKAAEAAVSVAGKPAAPAAAVAPAPEAKPAEPPAATWTGTISLGMVSLTGNSRSIAINLAAGAERKSEKWILGLKAAGSYGQAQAPDAAEWSTNALNATFQARGAFRFSPRYSAYLVGGIDTDHIASIEERPYGEAGVGILWLDEMEGDLSKLKLNTDIALRVANEYRFQYYPTVTNLDDVLFVAPRIGLSFRYALNKNIIFTEDGEVLPNVIGDARWLVNSTTKIAARIVNPLSVSVALAIKYDSNPAPGKENTDTALMFGVEAGF